MEPQYESLLTVYIAVTHYRQHRTLLTATLLSRLHPASATAPPKLRARIEKQHRLSLESAYRLGAGITSFHVRDPDPNAVDGGRVLGIRIEVFNPRKAVYDTPYYVFLNRPHGEAGAMRVHKHTIPPYVVMKSIVARWLPHESVSEGEGEGEGARARQDIVRFARALRAELVGAMKRRCALEELADEAKRRDTLAMVRAKDVEAAELELSWNDGAMGRVRLAKDGEVRDVYVAAADGGRSRHREQAIRGGDGRVEGIVQRLCEF